MADIASLLGKVSVGAATVSTVDSLITTYKKAVPKAPNTTDSVRQAAASAQPTTQQTTVRSNVSQPVSETVLKSRRELQQFKSLAYPSDPSPYEMVFNFIAYRPGNDRLSGRNLSSRTVREVQDSEEIVKLFNTTIVLPLPNNLVEGLGIQYEQFDQGNFVGDITAGLVTTAADITKAVQSASGISGILSSGADVLTDAGRGALNNLGRVNIATLEAAIRASATGTVGATIGQVRGNIVNPQRALQFSGVELRTYEYSWKFSPNSPDESETLKQILNTFQKKALPEKTDRYFLKYPDFVQVRFKRLEEELYEHKLCFIEGITIHRAPSGQPAFFADTNAPVEIEFTVKLRETSIRTRDDYLTRDEFGSEGE